MPTVSQAKNVMLRTISEIVDPPLTRGEKGRLWEHYQSGCAFCGRSIERASRTGHLDHIESNGGNGPRNRVLACARCNGDEKRDRDWREFLAEKCDDETVLARRLSVIESWVAMHPERKPASSAAVRHAKEEAKKLVDGFHQACTQLREALKASKT